MHLLMDCFGGDADTLRDVPTAEAYLYTLAEMSNMTVILPPRVHTTGDGVRGMIVLAESHAAIHADASDAFIDLFTCLEMSKDEAETIRDYTRRLYSFDGIHARMIERGLDTLQGG